MSGSSSGRDILQRLREEEFNVKTEQILETHPYITKAEKGELTLRQRRAFAQEQYAIQLSDAISFSVLAGHTDFRPTSLTNAKVPDPMRNKRDDDLFQFLLGGEIYAAKLLLQYAERLQLNEAALSSYETSAHAQAYPSYWARLALSDNRAAAAAACAVNYPAWGRMCLRLARALSDPDKGYGYNDGIQNDDALAFIHFFATPIDHLDDMAISIIEEEGASYEDLRESVRLLQRYEVMFWDTILDCE